MGAHTRARCCDRHTITLEDGRHISVDIVEAEARMARAAELRCLLRDVGTLLGWLVERLLAPLRASLADRALELPGNRMALEIAAACRTDKAVRQFASTRYGTWYGLR